MSELFVRLEVDWIDHPKLLRAGVDGAGLHAIAMCMAKRAERDGWIDRLLLARYGASDELIDRLVTLRLLEVDGDLVRPWGWLDRNPSQGAIAAMRATKAEAAKRGNHKRWGHDGGFDTCPKCHPKRRSSQGAIAPGSHTDRPRSPEAESESESERGNLLTPPPKPELVATDDPAAVVVDDRSIRAAAVAVSRAIDPPPNADPSAYAAGIARRILTGDDPTDRQRIEAELRSGRTVDEIAAAWISEARSWLDEVLPTGPTAPDPMARPRLAEFHGHAHSTPGDASSGLAAARAAVSAATPGLAPEDRKRPGGPEAATQVPMRERESHGCDSTKAAAS